VVLRAEMDVIVAIANVPHVLDPRPDYTVTPLRLTAWRGPDAGQRSHPQCDARRPARLPQCRRLFPPLSKGRIPMSSDLHLAGLSAPSCTTSRARPRALAAPCRQGADAAHRRSGRQPGGRFPGLCGADDAERYSAQDTVAAQGNLFLRAGTVLLSNEGRAMMTITASAVDYHDTIGGACSCESNTLRYGHHTKWQHACVENFLEANLLEGRGKRDIVSNINFFMNVPVEADGSLGIVDGISAPGLSLDLRAEMDVIVVVSNCPQINNPCNAFNPTPVRMIVAA
jgi:urea carboxylase-associated protein 1